MSLIEILITVIVFVLSLVIGIYFAGIPLRMSQMTKMQNIIQCCLHCACNSFVYVEYENCNIMRDFCVVFWNVCWKDSSNS